MLRFEGDRDFALRPLLLWVAAPAALAAAPLRVEVRRGLVVYGHTQNGRAIETNGRWC